MKKLILALASLLTVVGAAAQKLVIGEKAPDIKVAEWLWAKPADDGTPRLIEFFQPSSTQCAQRVGNIAAVAEKFKGKLQVILISKEPAASVREVTGSKGGTYFAATDDGGKTFEAYGVKFVPFGVLVDRRGRVLWFGNPTSLTEGEITRLIN